MFFLVGVDFIVIVSVQKVHQFHTMMSTLNAIWEHNDNSRIAIVKS
jgi:hypothetical protein